MVDAAPVDLLGRHVMERPEHGGACQRGVRQPSDTEVENGERAGVFTSYQVGRLDVPVHDARSVRMREAIAQLAHHPQALQDRQRHIPLHDLRQRWPGHVFHGDERFTVLLADVEDGDDVPVTKAPGGARFAHEPLPQRGVPNARHLYGYGSVDRRIAGEIQYPHAAAAEPLDDAIAANKGWVIGHWDCPRLLWILGSKDLLLARISSHVAGDSSSSTENNVVAQYGDVDGVRSFGHAAGITAAEQIANQSRYVAISEDPDRNTARTDSIDGVYAAADGIAVVV